MTNPFQWFIYRRRQLYASVSGRKGNLIKLSESKLLTKKEKELLDNVIEAIGQLNIEIKKFNNTKEKYVIKR